MELYIQLKKNAKYVSNKLKFNFLADKDYAMKITVDVNIVTVFVNGLEIYRKDVGEVRSSDAT